MRSGAGSVLVIGAGIAGLACAGALQAAGREVVVLDKGRAAGGRMSTRRAGAQQFDHGAQYFTARDPEFVAALRQWQQSGVVAQWHPRLAVIGERTGVGTVAAAQRYVGVPAMSALLRQLSHGLDLRAGHQVSALRRESGSWHVCCDQQGWLPQRFDSVVLALPPAQAAVLLDGHSDELLRCAQGVAMQPCWALMLHFGQSLTLPFDAAFVNAGALSWLARNSSKPGRDAGQECWVLHASVPWSEDHLELSASEAADRLWQAFCSLVQENGWADLPHPLQRRAHRWRYARAGRGAGQSHALDEALRLGLCGDWLPGERVEAAWCSGRSLARALLAD